MRKQAKRTRNESKVDVPSRVLAHLHKADNLQRADYLGQLASSRLSDSTAPLLNRHNLAKYIGKHSGNQVLQRMLTVNKQSSVRVAREPQSPDERIRNTGPIAPTPPASTMIPKTVGEIQSQVNSFIDLKTTLTDIADILKGKSKSDLVAAENLLGAAGNMAELAQIYQDYSGKLQALPAAKVAARIGEIQTIIGRTKLVAALANNRALKAFKDDPTNFELASKWANDAADTFAKAASLVPGKIPFVSSMLKRTLAAPAVYVRAFNRLLEARIAKIDVYADIGDKMKYGSGKSGWTGHLAQLFGINQGLQAFMHEHRKVDGIDLQKVHGKLGSAHLINLINRYPYWDNRQKRHYVNIIQHYAENNPIW